MKSSFQKRWGHERLNKRNGKSLIKAQKRLEAEQRQLKYNALSLAEKQAINPNKRITQ
jgi:hypothetical protein